MVKYFLLSVLLLVSSQPLFSQTNYESFKGTSVKSVVPSRLEDPYYCIYRDSMQNPVRLIYKWDFNSAATPEDYVFSVYCGSIPNVPNALSYYGVKPDTTSRNGLLLLHKLTFSWLGVETAIVKYADFYDSTIVKSYVIQLQHLGTTWKRVDIAGIKDVEKAMLLVRSKKFWAVYQKRSSEVAAVNEFKKLVKDEDGVMSISLFSDMLAKLKSTDKVTYDLLCDN